jgi:hypothetical protein
MSSDKKQKKPSGIPVIIEFAQITNNKQEVPRWQKDGKRIPGKRSKVKELQKSLSGLQKSMLQRELKHATSLSAHLAGC